MDVTSKPVRKATERYWMMESRTVYAYGFNDRVEDEYKTANTHNINVGNKFPSLPRKYIHANRGTLHKGISKLLPN